MSLSLSKSLLSKGKTLSLSVSTDRQNQNTALFLENLNDILKIITKDNKHCYMMGDFNLDLLQYSRHDSEIY